MMLTEADAFVVGMVARPLTWEHWPIAKAFLDPALRRSDEDWPQVEPELAAERMQLWAVMDGATVIAAAVTRLALVRGGEVAEVYLVGGTEHGRWIGQLNRTIEQSAREIRNCIGLRAYGRVGWEKSLSALGWMVTNMIFEKAF